MVRKSIAIFTIFLMVITISPYVIYADDIDELQKEIDQTKQELDAIRSANETNKQTLDDLNARIESIKLQFDAIEREIGEKELEVEKQEGALGERKGVLEIRVQSYYKLIAKNSSVLANLFAAENLSTSMRTFFYQEKYMNRDRTAIEQTTSLIQEINEKKASLELDRERLLPIKEELNTQSTFLAQEVEKADEYEEELEGKIAALTAKQQSILSARSGGGITSVGEVPTSGDPNATIAFKSQAPANSFAAFSFGAYTHRNGMSQYGAKARAESGQSTEDILNAYFPGSNLNKSASVPGDIEVQGHGTVNFKEYLYGIYEMPESWPLEALKAQAVLARTYAIRAGKPICTTEACQVYKHGQPKSGAWKQAVDETENWVLDNIQSAQYSSTTGGYTNFGGWDTTDNSNTGDWTSRAYESMANSPWFYRSWYRQGYRDDGNSCGRAHPWLSEEEFADIINAWIVRKNPNEADTNRIIPVTIGECPVGGASGDPYSKSELRELADKSGGAVTSVSVVSTSNNNQGLTTSVSVSTNRGTITIPGYEFKETFNIRAPGYISIPQAGFAFFNIEQT